MHRIPLAIKYLLLFGLTIPSLIMRSWQITTAVLVISVALLLGTKIRLKIALYPGSLFVAMLFAVALMQLWYKNYLLSYVLPANILSALYLSRMLTYTTSGAVLIESIINVTKPLDRIGFKSSYFGLAVAIMVRSIPFLIGNFYDVRDAARARGLERNLYARIAPVVINAVAYAKRTGEALQARGLADD